MVTPAQEHAFTAFAARWAASKPPRRRPLHVPDAIAMFMRLHEAGEELDRDAVRAWFRRAGWAKVDARELARIAATVGRELAEHDRAPRAGTGRVVLAGSDPPRARAREAYAVPAPSVLVAEDEAPIAAVLLDLLAEAGFAVRHARDGAEALAEIERDPPDLLISNVKMPRVDGLLLTRHATTRVPPIPVVLIGANGDGTDVPGAVFVAKPVDRDRLVDLIWRTYRDGARDRRATA